MNLLSCVLFCRREIFHLFADDGIDQWLLTVGYLRPRLLCGVRHLLLGLWRVHVLDFLLKNLGHRAIRSLAYLQAFTLVDIPSFHVELG